MDYTRYELELKDRLPCLVGEPAHCEQDFGAFVNPEVVNAFARDALRLDRKAEEHMMLLALDSRFRLLGVLPVAKGTVDNVRFSPREMFIRLLMCGAVYFVAVHNHPSGSETPSDEDNKVTERIRYAGRVLSVPMLDHVIIGADGAYYSYTRARKQEQERQEAR